MTALLWFRNTNSECNFFFFQPLIRLYDIPDNTFDANNEDEDDEDDEGEEGEVADTEEGGNLDTIVEEKPKEATA